jgi:hypothetical protein
MNDKATSKKALFGIKLFGKKTKLSADSYNSANIHVNKSKKATKANSLNID